MTYPVSDPRIYRLEMWCGALEAFFTLEHIPLSSYEKEHSSIHNFRSEMVCVKKALDLLLRTLTDILGEDAYLISHFTDFLRQMGATPADESRMIQAGKAVKDLQDIRRIAYTLTTVSFLDLQAYQAFGRLLHGFILHQEITQRLAKEKVLPPLEEIVKEKLRELLRRVRKAPQGKAFLTAVFVHLKILSYLQNVARSLENPGDYPALVTLFALIHKVWTTLESYLLRYLPKLEDTLIFPSRMEIRKVMELELVDVNLLLDQDAVRAKIEDSYGILRDLFQQNIVSIMNEATGEEVKGPDLFIYYRTRREQSMELLESLKSLESAVDRFVQDESRPAHKHLMEELETFRKEKMKYLMYKDWSQVNRYYYDLKNTDHLKQVIFIAHQMQVFLKTLIQEVSKRGVLHEPYDASGS